jgi:ribosome recycling factor
MKTGQPTPSTFNNVKEVEASGKQRMDKVLGDFQHALSTIRTGRASASILEPVKVDYYGTPTPLKQVGVLHVPEPSLITVQPFDVSQINAIEKAIRSADLGLNPSNDGKLIRIPVPPLTEERRKELVKYLHKMAEEHRIIVRNVRRDLNDSLKKLLKDKLISEDDEKRALDDVQKTTDAYLAKLDQAAKAKEKEVLELK